MGLYSNPPRSKHCHRCSVVQFPSSMRIPSRAAIPSRSRRAHRRCRLFHPLNLIIYHRRGAEVELFFYPNTGKQNRRRRRKSIRTSCTSGVCRPKKLPYYLLLPHIVSFTQLKREDAPLLSRHATAQWKDGRSPCCCYERLSVPKRRESYRMNGFDRRGGPGPAREIDGMCDQMEMSR